MQDYEAEVGADTLSPEVLQLSFREQHRVIGQLRNTIKEQALEHTPGRPSNKLLSCEEFVFLSVQIELW